MESPKSPKDHNCHQRLLYSIKLLILKEKMKAFHDKKQNKGIYD